MDEDYFIKIEQEQQLKQDESSPNYFMTNFYDQDSRQENSLIKRQDLQQSGYPIAHEQLVQKLEQSIDIRTMSNKDIVDYAKDHYAINQTIDWNQFLRCLKKRKLIMKKTHAKNRNCPLPKQEYFVITDVVEGVDKKQEAQAEIKKKRNRMSAQISRDRKKQKIQQLQLNNKKLKAETEKIIQENERLKKQLEQFNKTEEKKVQTSKSKNKLLQLLIMFGIFFLLTVVKQSFKTGFSLKGTSKIAKQQEIAPASQQIKLLQDSQKIFQNMELGSDGIFGGQKAIKDVIFKLEEMKSTAADIPIPKLLKHEIQIIKRQVS